MCCVVCGDQGCLVGVYVCPRMPGAGCSWYMRRLCSCYQRKMIFKIFDCQIKWHVRKLGSKAIKSEIQMPIGHCQVRSALWDICVWCAVVVDIDVSRVCLSVCLCVSVLSVQVSFWFYMALFLLSACTLGALIQCARYQRLKFSF